MVIKRSLLPLGAMAALLGCSGCTTVPDPPAAVGDGFPGTCLPGELSWPTDFLGSLPGESDAVGGSIVGLRLEYVDARWVWRLRSVDPGRDVLGEQGGDPSRGRESIVDVRTLETLASKEVELTAAEQASGVGILDAAQRSGEQWPGPLIVEMTRGMDDGRSTWRITVCDTETDEYSVRVVH